MSMIDSEKKRRLNILIEKCSDVRINVYKPIPYIKAAIEIQSQKEDSGKAILLDCSKNRYAEWPVDYEHQHKIIVLARMIFEKKGNNEFRRPLIGEANFLGGTEYNDWSLEPIEIINNIPFLIINDYILGGLPERSETYIEYCIKECVWRKETYRIPTQKEMQDALYMLLKSDKWKRNLDKYELESLELQTK